MMALFGSEYMTHGDDVEVLRKACDNDDCWLPGLLAFLMVMQGLQLAADLKVLMGPFDTLARRRPERHFPALAEAAVLLSLEKVIPVLPCPIVPPTAFVTERCVGWHFFSTSELYRENLEYVPVFARHATIVRSAKIKIFAEACT